MIRSDFLEEMSFSPFNYLLVQILLLPYGNAVQLLDLHKGTYENDQLVSMTQKYCMPHKIFKRNVLSTEVAQRPPNFYAGHYFRRAKGALLYARHKYLTKKHTHILLKKISNSSELTEETPDLANLKCECKV